MKEKEVKKYLRMLFAAYPKSTAREKRQVIDDLCAMLMSRVISDESSDELSVELNDELSDEP